VGKAGKNAAEITNSEIAEWLALEAEEAEGILIKAFRRASRSALLWPIEAASLLASGRSLTELANVGPFIEKTILRWFETPPVISKPSPLRRDFFTLSEARAILKRTGLGFPRGDLQMHTVSSDGAGSVMDMAEAGLQLGYEYIAVTDHSKGLKIAGGMDETELREQGEEISAVNSQLASRGFRVLRSIEMNLNPRGEGDMEPEALAELDLVVGSFHSRLRVTEDQTERYLAALRNPQVHILGHPRGRIYNFRIGLSADWPRVFDEAARLEKAVEIDAYPDRQDLDVKLLKIARDSGVKLAIDTDAHSPAQLMFIELGLAAAAAAKFPVERIVNLMPVDQLLAWTKGAKKPRRPRTRMGKRQSGAFSTSPKVVP
jgi:histidinol phosphatase-like PHP family hydrolase